MQAPANNSESTNKPEPTENPAEPTRQRIMAATEALFVERGFATMSLRAIAQAADVNLTATHYPFRTNQGLLRLAALQRLHQLVVAGLLQANKPSAQEQPL